MKIDENGDIPDDYLVEIGRVTVRWSRLEGIINLCMIELLGKNILEGRSLVLFTHMSFPQKMEVMGALVVECLTVLAYSWLSEYSTKVEPLLRSASKRRNAIVHSKFGIEKDGSVGRSNISARGELKIISDRLSIKEIESLSEAIVQAAEALMEMTFSKQIASKAEQSGQ